LKPAKVITYDPTQTDFSPTAEQFKAANVDGVIILAIPKPTISFLNSMADLNFRPTRIMTQVAAIPATFQAAPREFPGSYVGAFIPPLQGSNNPQVSQFVQAMHRYEPSAPVSEFAAWGWMEAQVAIAGLRNVHGSMTRQSYMQALERVQNLQTLGGTVTYSAANHHGLTQMFMVQAKNNQFLPVKN
jgi:ABC-type branched-subunit amino acid transport system substrate-binding protein